jgi:hypothetical protein
MAVPAVFAASTTVELLEVLKKYNPVALSPDE